MTNEEMLKNCLCTIDRISDRCGTCQTVEEIASLQDFILSERDTLSKSCCSNVVNMCRETPCAETPTAA